MNFITLKKNDIKKLARNAQMRIIIIILACACIVVACCIVLKVAGFKNDYLTSMSVLV